MKKSMSHLRTRFAEISFLGFLLVLAGRASFAGELPTVNVVQVPTAIVSIR